MSHKHNENLSKINLHKINQHFFSMSFQTMQSSKLETGRIGFQQMVPKLVENENDGEIKWPLMQANVLY